MTSRERLLAAYAGKPVDRPPLWLREGLSPLDSFPPETDFSLGWKAHPLYRDLYQAIVPFADYIADWNLPGMNRFLLTPEKYFSRNKRNSPARIETAGSIRLPGKALSFREERRPGENMSWLTEAPVKTVEELIGLFRLPFEVDTAGVRKSVEAAREQSGRYGETALMRLNLSSPIVCISAAMQFELFLEMSLVEETLYHEILAELTRRILAILDIALPLVDFPTIANLGGSEQCTPPMMDPEAFDRFVLPYDKPIVDALHRHGILVNCHCHGKVSHALKVMAQIGFDGTEPVEPPPQGDCTLAQARSIAGDKLTLIGNLEWVELESSSPQEIEDRVAEIFALGPRRLIIGASAGPVSAVNARLAENYKAWMRAYRRLCGM